MGVKIQISRKARQTLGIRFQNGKVVRDESKVLPEVRRLFRVSGPKNIRKAVLRDVSKGISPVKGQGKFLRYSKSYKDMILGKKHFRTINGKVIPIDGPDPILPAATPKKRRSPVTMRFTGQLHNALKLLTSGGFGARFKLVFDWRDRLADIHNRRGAGKSKGTRNIRRLLPTENGEEFNRSITEEILNQLNKAAKKVARAFS